VRDLSSQSFFAHCEDGMAETPVSDHTELLERGEPDGTSVPQPLRMSRILQVSMALVAVIGAALVWSGHGIASHMQSIASASLLEPLGLSEAEATADFETAQNSFRMVNKDGWYLVTEVIRSRERDTYGMVAGHKATCVQEAPFSADEAWVTSRETTATGVVAVIKPAMEPDTCLSEEGAEGGVSTTECADATLVVRYDGKYLIADHGADEDSNEGRNLYHAICCDDEGVKALDDDHILHQDSMCIWKLEPVIGSLARDSWTFKLREDHWAGKTN